MTDFIKEFGDNQQGKKVPINFGKEIQRSIPIQQKVKYVNFKKKYFDPKTKTVKDVDWISLQQPPYSQNEDKKISEKDLKEVVTETVLNFMNGPETEPIELLEDQKIEVEKRIKEYCNHQGMMSIYFSEEPQLNEAWVGAIIDPTNKKSWIHLKQEKICTVPYAYRKPLMEYAKKVWNENKMV